MSQQKVKPQVLTNGLLKKYLELYHDDLPVTVEIPGGELLGVLDVGTAVAEPGRVLVVAATTIKSEGRKTEPVVVAK